MSYSLIFGTSIITFTNSYVTLSESYYPSDVIRNYRSVKPLVMLRHIKQSNYINVW